jgi:RimJ/RimL family protein N-acetyltransferase
MTEVTLREVSGSWWDAQLISSWRNANSAAFPEQEPWDARGQQAWYNDVYRDDPSLNLYFVLVDGMKIGTVGMRIKGGQGEIMWLVLGNKDYAREGYMKQGMRKLMEAYGLEYYWGQVMPDNEAGLKFHKANGFSVLGEKDGMLYIDRDFDGTWPERKSS